MIRDVVWACLVCGTEGGLDRNSVCQTCGARYSRGRGATIVVRPAAGQESVYAMAELTALLPPPGSTGTAHCTIQDSAGDWPLYGNGMYLGRIEKLGPPLRVSVKDALKRTWER